MKGNRQICSFIPHRYYSNVNNITNSSTSSGDRSNSNNVVNDLKKNGSCITAINIYHGSRFRDPFFVTGSEDNDAMVMTHYIYIYIYIQ